MHTPKSNRFLEIDALRGIAATTVVIFHFSKDVSSTIFLRFGVTAVDLFFIISGFVIIMTLEKCTSWKDFAISRFSRLFPTYCTCVTLMALLITFNMPAFGRSSYSQLFTDYLANLTMFQQFFRRPDLDPPYWTMVVEMLFYLCMLMVFLFKKLKYIELIGALALIPIFIFSLDWMKFNHAHTYRLIRIYFPLFSHLPLFFAGIIFYKIKFDKEKIFRYLLLIACFICQLSLFDDGGFSFAFILYNHYVFLITAYFIIFFLYTRDKLKFLKNRVLLFLGNISFCLYLFHHKFGTHILIPNLIKFLHINYWFAAGIAFIIVIITATIISYGIEKPALQFLRRRFRKSN